VLDLLRRLSRLPRESFVSLTLWFRPRCKLPHCHARFLHVRRSNMASSWEDLEEKPVEGQWTYFERNAA
jgi:hypothetical protein